MVEQLTPMQNPRIGNASIKVVGVGGGGQMLSTECIEKELRA